jgi:putative AdoMet-dependent methyltransferase
MKEHFNEWAKTYDRSVLDPKNEFPFDGYLRVLDFIQAYVKSNINGKKVLDVGIGTGLLTQKLYELGADIYGLDFSEQMISKAKEKMPNSRLTVCDISLELPRNILRQKFDCIISAYTFHHFDDARKVAIIATLKNVLNKNGLILIGDVSFLSSNEFNHAKNEHADKWDNSEYYFAADEFIKRLNENNTQCTYIQISKCGGVFAISL